MRRWSLGHPYWGIGIQLISVNEISNIVILWRLLKESGRTFSWLFFIKKIYLSLGNWPILSLIEVSKLKENTRIYRLNNLPILSEILFSSFPFILRAFKFIQSKSASGREASLLLLTCKICKFFKLEIRSSKTLIRFDPIFNS